MQERIRSPILINMGHVDHGKTTLLDRIRGTVVAKAEPGLITQHISASYVPIEVIRGVCAELLKRIHVDFRIPGFLWIDSPGHEAFTTLRKRGGAIADLGVLVVDINEGFRPQTDESLNFLKQFRTPFVVAATKIDRISGWNSAEGSCFLDSIERQPERTRKELEEKLYSLVGQLSERGFSSERYDRVSDFAKSVAIVPVSGITGEGIPDLLVTIGGLSQRFMSERLRVTPGEGKGTVLEVKEFRGLGTTIDVILYDGEIRKGDNVIVGGSEVVRTRVKAILEPKPLRELRSEKDFVSRDYVSAAAGVKIAAPGLEKVVAGSPVRFLSNDRDVEKAVEEVREEVSEVEIETDAQGAIVKADTLGSLEALVKTLREKGIPIRKAHVGEVNRSEIMELRTLEEPMIFAFCVRVSDEMKKLAEDNKVKIFSSDVIYRLVEEYEKWIADRKKREEEAILESVARPGRVRLLPGCVFRQSKPAVFGVEVLKGVVRQKAKLRKGDEVLGEIREMQMRGESVKEAVAGDRVAISMDGIVVGKDVKEGDELETFISDEERERLRKVLHLLRGDEKELLEEWEHGQDT